MSEPHTPAMTLDPDPEAIAVLSAKLRQMGYDDALQALRVDYFTAPFANLEEVARRFPALDDTLATAIRVFTFGEPAKPGALESGLGRELVEAALLCGLLRYDERHDHFDTGGFTLVTRLGQHFVVSANPYYPSFAPSNAAVYMGPDSYTLANALHARSATLPASGEALDLCCGSGIAGQSALTHRADLTWTGIDLSADAVAAAGFNATLNGVADRYRPRQGDLFAPVRGRRFDLVVANPPFIPVPDGLDFPVYGAGGEDGRLVLAPLLEHLPEHLNDGGRAVIYGEGIGRDGRLLLEDDVEALQNGGWDVTVTVIAEAPIESALYTLGVMLSRLKPPRLPEIVRWRDLFTRLQADRYAKFLIDVQAGEGRVAVRRVCPDPARLREARPGIQEAGERT